MTSKEATLILAFGAILVLLIYGNTGFGTRLAEPETSSSLERNVFWPVVARRSDQRAFVQQPSGKDAFRIVLITGSSGKANQSVSEGGRPSSNGDVLCDISIGYPLQAFAQEVEGRPTEVYHYLMVGSRLPETLMAEKDAVSRLKPDALIIGINPMMLLNDQILYRSDSGKRNWNVKMLDGPYVNGELSAAVRLVRPSDLEYAITRFIPVSEKRSDLARDLENFVSLFPATKRASCKDRPIPFEGWNYDTLIEKTAFVMGDMAEQDSIYAAQYSGMLIDHAVQSGIPVYFYAEPIHPSIEKTYLGERLKSRLASFSDQVKAAKNSKIRFDASTLFLMKRPEFFTDYIHPVNADLLARHLAGKVIGDATGTEPGFTRIAGRELIGNRRVAPAATASPDDCEALCRKENGCLAYSFSRDKTGRASCFLSADPELSIRNTAATTGFSDRARLFDLHDLGRHRVMAGYRIEGDEIAPEDDTKTGRIADCAALCESEKCQALSFAFDGRNAGQCRIYASVKSTIRTRGSVLSIIKVQN